MTTIRCTWTVSAGIIPGETDIQYSKRWELSNMEWDSPKGAELFFQRRAEAEGYSRYLEAQSAQGRMVNWVQLLFLWY